MIALVFAMVKPFTDLYITHIILQVALLFEADMTPKTCDDFHTIVNACYSNWLKKSRKQEEESVRKYGEMLYSRFSKR